MIESKGKGQCTIEVLQTGAGREVIPDVVKRLRETCGRDHYYDHIHHIPIPDRDKVVDIIVRARRILFPGYFTDRPLDHSVLDFFLGQEISDLYDRLADQIQWAHRHDCFRYNKDCIHCADQALGETVGFIEALPEIRRLLGLDVEAALRGDPAAGSVDEIIFSYPGVFAVTVYRLAHVLFEMGVPLLPRIMSEWAHAKTGIDINPGAEIGESFFIDHGTGVVIGQTAIIGDRVRLYQGVTLGALSVAADKIEQLKTSKRHPTIEDDVTIYSGATVLGGATTIGAGSIIGGSVWLTKSVPPGSKVILKTPELISIGPDNGM